MLAEDSLLRQVDSLLQSGYSAQAVDLPDSATVNFKDAGSRLGRANQVFTMLGPAGKYRSVSTNFGRAIASYLSADADGAGHSARSQREAASARTYLTRAEDVLNQAPEATQPQALDAESAALSAVTPPPAKHVRHRRTHHRKPAHHTVPSAHHSTTQHPRPAVTLATATVTPTIAPSPTPTPQPTSTPAPTSTPTPRPTPRPTRPAHHGPSARVLAALHALSEQRSALGKALHRAKVCRTKVAGLAGGSDPTGADSIFTCLHRGLHAVGRLALSSLSRLPSLTAQHGSITRAGGNLDLARSELQKARADLQAVDLPATAADLDAAVTALQRTRDTLVSIERGVKQAS